MMKQLMFQPHTTRQVSLRCNKTALLSGSCNLVEQIQFPQLTAKIVATVYQLTLQMGL